MPFVPIGDRPLAFLDTETTGLQYGVHEVIEVGIIKEDLGGVERRFHTLVKPEHLDRAEPKALEINGFAKSASRWDDAPLMKELGPHILDFLSGCVVVGHNVKFDLEMLKAHLLAAGVNPGGLPYHAIDTMTLMYEHLVPCGVTSVSLKSARSFFGWPTEGAHTAMKDAEDARRLYHTLMRATPADRLLWRARAMLRESFSQV